MGSFHMMESGTGIVCFPVQSHYERRFEMKRSLAIIVSVLLLGVPAISSMASADQSEWEGLYLSMMGGAGMMGGGGGMMNDDGYGGSRNSMGDRRSGQNIFHDRDHNSNAYEGDRHRIGNDDYRQDEHLQISNELRAKKRELSNMIRSGNADPAAVERKMNEIERLEQVFEDRR
jgi:Spy/CpxP family protein refolding chaperone